MSYGQQSRTTESWNNDPNNFHNASGPDNTRGNWNDNQQRGSQRPTQDPTDTAQWNTGTQNRGFDRTENVQPGQGQFWSAGPGESYGSTGYQGNTTDADTFGAGGNQFGGGGRGAGVDRQDWTSGNQNNMQGDNYNSDVNPGAGKASMGERLKGNAEKMAGRVTGNPSMVERGQVRKSGNPDDTSWNSNNY